MILAVNEQQMTLSGRLSNPVEPNIKVTATSTFRSFGVHCRMPAGSGFMLRYNWKIPVSTLRKSGGSVKVSRLKLSNQRKYLKALAKV